MRGLLDVRATAVTLGIMERAAIALARSVKEPDPEHVLPSLHDGNTAVRVASGIAYAVADEAIKSGIARVKPDPKQVRKNAALRIRRYAKIERFALRHR
jgi:malate dehydrogenase (oxaloacetate-decarboxylating)